MLGSTRRRSCTARKADGSPCGSNPMVDGAVLLLSPSRSQAGGGRRTTARRQPAPPREDAGGRL